ncbi:hypothetical protein XM38_007760 [Halomicronema hongdechloris C2206]|uniref:Low-complexity tail membrane protein n=1 Tax=Halomicronema hongdechloris C2206 TaxID=1641165 RepID=A0A1Z3HHS8_9CYAN|nr:low-complexity tail membrane protein [Halomicronema hongdechloris]ASC69846.1 hypothetical protein XM38_007760 [Halomicronema hongdechloris C2206]
MQSFRLDPYLWIHLAGLAAVPLWFDVCLLGLAAGDPVLPVWLELGVLAVVGVLPVLWMQWQRPFCIFSLVALALKPDQMSPNQRRLLHLFQDPIGRGVSLLVPLPLLWGLWQLYRLAPLAANSTPFSNRGVGVLVAAIAFLLVNLFTQVPVRVLRVLLAPATALDGVDPYAPEAIPQDFTLIGLRVNQILPPLEIPSAEAPPESPSQPAVTDQEEIAPAPLAKEDKEDGDETDDTIVSQTEPAPEEEPAAAEMAADVSTDAGLAAWPVDDSVEALDYEGQAPQPAESESVDSPEGDGQDGPESSSEESSAIESHVSSDAPQPDDSNGYHLQETDVQPPKGHSEHEHESSSQSPDEPGDAESRSE